MRLLLDTQILLWAAAAPERLGDMAAVIQDTTNDLLLSAASSWEVAVKYAIGELPLPEPPERYVPHVIQRLGVTALPIEHSHAFAVAQLPHHHRDPFDRMLIAQARMLRVPVMSVDPAFHAYDVEVLGGR